MVTREPEPSWVIRGRGRDAKIKAEVAERKRKEAEYVGDYEYLGWQNGWGDSQDKYKRCHNLGHKPEYISLSIRGTHNVFKCDECRIWWNLDWGD